MVTGGGTRLCSISWDVGVNCIAINWWFGDRGERTWQAGAKSMVDVR